MRRCDGADWPGWRSHCATRLQYVLLWPPISMSIGSYPHPRAEWCRPGVGVRTKDGQPITSQRVLHGATAAHILAAVTVAILAVRTQSRGEIEVPCTRRRGDACERLFSSGRLACDERRQRSDWVSALLRSQLRVARVQRDRDPPCSLRAARRRRCHSKRFPLASSNLIIRVSRQPWLPLLTSVKPILVL